MCHTKKIVISGYYGFDNIGDEAVLYAIVTSLKDTLGDIQITVLSNNPTKTQMLYDVDAINRWHFGAIKKAIKDSDMLISGGGSLLQDITSNKTIPYYLGIVMLAQWYKKKVVFYSQGIGPVNRSYYKWMIKKVTNRIDGLFVRDQHSKKVLEEMKVKKPIIVAADPVLGIKSKRVLDEHTRDLEVLQKRVGVYIRPWHNEEELLNALEQTLKYLLKEGYKICLIPMHYTQDLEIAQKLKFKLGETVRIVDQMLTIDEVIHTIEICDFIIGMRLHSLIMAAAIQVPMIGLSYDPKVTDFMKDMQIPYCLEVEGLEAQKLTEQVRDLIKHLPVQKQHLKNMYKLQIEKISLPTEYIKKLLS